MIPSGNSRTQFLSYWIGSHGIIEPITISRFWLAKPESCAWRQTRSRLPWHTWLSVWGKSASPVEGWELPQKEKRTAAGWAKDQSTTSVCLLWLPLKSESLEEQKLGITRQGPMWVRFWIHPEMKTLKKMGDLKEIRLLRFLVPSLE